MKSKKRRYYIEIVSVFIIILFVIWAAKVYAVNTKNIIEEQVYRKGEQAVLDSWKLELSEARLLTKQEFGKYFETEYESSNEPGDKILCIKLKVEFRDCDLKTRDLEKLVENGFRTLTWYQGIDPFFFAELNETELGRIYETGKGFLWIVVNVPVEIWNEEDTYDYVLSTYPKVIIIRTVIEKENDKA